MFTLHREVRTLNLHHGDGVAVARLSTAQHAGDYSDLALKYAAVRALGVTLRTFGSATVSRSQVDTHDVLVRVVLA